MNQKNNVALYKKVKKLPTAPLDIQTAIAHLQIHSQFTLNLLKGIAKSQSPTNYNTYVIIGRRLTFIEIFEIPTIQ